MKKGICYTYAILVVVVLLFLDQGSKWMVQAYLPQADHFLLQYPYGGIGVFRNFLGVEFSINHVTNTGAAWGMLGHYQTPLVFLRIFLICALCLYCFFYRGRGLHLLPLLLVIGGAIGNVLDYFIYGHVIDMFHFVFWGYDFPVFNMADSAISIGIAALFLLSFMQPTEKQEI